MYVLERSTIPYRLVGITALDRYFGSPLGPVQTVEIDEDVVALARGVGDVRFPGLPNWDALIPIPDGDILVRCAGDTRDVLHPFLDFSYDPERHAFSDPHGLYPTLKEARARLKPTSRRRSSTITGMTAPEPLSIESLPAEVAATVAARLPLRPDSFEPWPSDPVLGSEFHRLLLAQVVTGRYAARGLQILLDSGYLEAVVPEIAMMDSVEQSKEHHPEGNVWAHTLETFTYRKTNELNLGLALLFHDCGKPRAASTVEHKFAAHADLGARIARQALSRLGCDQSLVEDVAWLCRFHMIPGALERLPDYRRDPLMASPLFPTLLELYRCDLSSTFRGPEPYYQACRVYRRFIKKNKGLNSSTRSSYLSLVAEKA